MIVEKRGKWLVYDVNGSYKKFKTKAEAEKAAGGAVETEDKFDAIVPEAPLQENENGSEETKEADEAPHYGWQVEDEEVDSEE